MNPQPHNGSQPTPSSRLATGSVGDGQSAAGAGLRRQPITASGDPASHDTPIKATARSAPCDLTLDPLRPVRLAIPSDPRYLRLVRDLVERLGEMIGFGSECRFHMQLAVDEALTNIIRHAYGERHDQPIDLCFEISHQQGQGQLTVTITDWGCGLNPSTIPTRDLRDTRPGGMGVHIMKTVMDEVLYQPLSDGGTRLRLVKCVPNQSPTAASGAS